MGRETLKGLFAALSNSLPFVRHQPKSLCEYTTEMVHFLRPYRVSLVIDGHRLERHLRCEVIKSSTTWFLTPRATGSKTQSAGGPYYGEVRSILRYVCRQVSSSGLK